MDDSLAEVLRDESRNSGRAESVSFPKNEERSLRLWLFAEAKGSLLLCKGHARFSAAAVPYGGHVLNCSKMNQ
jgi:D-lactate dehydrogenase (cytochrome)